MRASIFFVVGTAAAVLAGCGGLGSSATASSNSAKTSPSPGRGNFNGAAGQLTKLTGSSMTISDQAGTVTVSYDSSTSVLQSGTGSMTDIAAGVCVTANGDREANGSVTATGVQVMLNMNGNCNQPAAGFGNGNGQGPGGASPRPSGSPRAGRPTPSPGATPANLAFVRGKVSSVSGTTVTVEQDTGGPVTVTVPSTARITRTVSSTTARLAVGECIAATGQRDSSGAVKARAIVISAPGPNGCTIAGAGGRGFGPGGRPSASPRSA